MSAEADIVNLAVWKRRHAHGPAVDPVIAMWKCRAPLCITRIGVTKTAFETLAFFNEHIATYRGTPITEHEVMVCKQHEGLL